ncbi:MAG: hypothetical protein P1U56_00055 [Saprospiraceae bacterium]|nr:hypothetical protein [Saprospiraceae bacterium]
MKMKNDIPINVSSIDFTISNNPKTGNFSDIGKEAMKRYNGYTTDSYIHVSGKYIGNEYPQFKDGIYTYLANKKANNRPDIVGDKVVCLPCPDFCVGRIDLITNDQRLSRGKRNKKQFNLKNLNTYSLEKIGGYLRRRRITKVYLSPVNDLFAIYNKLKKDKYVYIYELRLMLLMLSYTLHQYKYARRMKYYLDKNYSNYASYLELKGMYDDIEDKIVKKYTNKLASKRKHVTIVRLDNNHGGFLYPWQDIVKAIIEDVSVKNDYDPEIDDMNESNINSAYINQIHSVNKKNVLELVKSISNDSDMIIVIGHGDINNTLHYYNDGSFKGKETLVSNKEFIEALNKNLNHDKVLLFFACNAKNILNDSSFNYTIGSDGEYNIGMLMPFLIGFLSSYFTSDADIKLCFERGKRLETVLSKQGKTIKMK